MDPKIVTHRQSMSPFAQQTFDLALDMIQMSVTHPLTDYKPRVVCPECAYERELKTSDAPIVRCPSCNVIMVPVQS